MGMTLDDFETKALQVLLSQRFIDLPLFEEEELSNYEVADIQGSMPFDDFIRQYAEIIMEQVKATYEQRVKADLVAMLTELQIEFDEKYWRDTQGYIIRRNGFNSGIEICVDIIQEKINALKAEAEDQDGQTSN